MTTDKVLRAMADGPLKMQNSAEWLADRDAVRRLVEALPKCEVCEAQATRVYIVRHKSERWELEYCDAHEHLGPACNTWSEPVDSDEAPSLRMLLERMKHWSSDV